MRAIALSRVLRPFCTLLAVAGLLAVSVSLRAQTPSGQLRIFVIDVEGGQSTLFVTPDKHSLLIDTGWPDLTDAMPIVLPLPPNRQASAKSTA